MGRITILGKKIRARAPNDLGDCSWIQFSFLNLRFWSKLLHPAAILSWMQASLFALQIQPLPVQFSPEMPSFSSWNTYPGEILSPGFGLRSSDASEFGWSSCLLHICLSFVWCIFCKFSVSEIFWVCCSQYVHTYLSAQTSKSSLSACLNPSCLMANSCLSSSRSKNEAKWRGYLTKHSTPCFQTHHEWEPPPIVQWLAHWTPNWFRFVLSPEKLSGEYLLLELR